MLCHNFHIGLQDYYKILYHIVLLYHSWLVLLESVCIYGGSNAVIMLCVGRLPVVVLYLCLFGLERVDALTAGSSPFPRYGMGFAATPDGMLYVFGGYSSGNEGKKREAGKGWRSGSMGLIAWDAVMRRARAAPLLSLFFSPAEGTRVGRE